MTALLRPAVEADLNHVVQIERACFADPWTEESFRRLLGGHPAIFQVIGYPPDTRIAGYVIACFGDPGLDAAREIASGPVIGIAEAAMHTASHLGSGFSVVTTLKRTIGRATELAEHYGMQRFCCGIHACEIPVLELDTDPDARKVITEACRDAVEADGSDSVVLGCAGMADMCSDISAELGVPVIDGVTAATLTVRSLVTMGLRTSKRGEFATPPPKAYTAG